MKEKKAVCPICGGGLQVQGKALFVEHHKQLWEEIAEEHGVVDSYGFSFGRLYHGEYGCGVGIPKNKPAGLIKWEQENPRPQITQTEFVLLLANRVAALEAALVKKGGVR